jgi:hypothetical protein
VTTTANASPVFLLNQWIFYTSEHVAPVLNRSVLDLPLPPARPKNARLSADELIESDQEAGEVA